MIKRLLFLFLIAASAALMMRAFVIEGIYVASASMEPTLKKDVSFFLDKVTLKFRKVKRGEIIVFSSPVDKDKDLIKRVIAVSNDEIKIVRKRLFLNSKPLFEKYVQYTRANELLKGDNLGPISVPRGHVFVMGDNRDESNDSRDWVDKETGKHIYFIREADIKGRIIQFI